MTINENRALCLLLLFLMMISLSSCDLLLMPFECVYNASNYKKDVSDDPERNMLVGREFVLTDDVILFQYAGEEEFFIWKHPPYIATYPKGSKEDIIANQQFIPFRETVKSGTKLKISQVLVGANYLGGELCISYVRAQFTDLTGKLVIADISNLFNHVSFSESWNLVPNPQLLVEIGTGPASKNRST